MLQPSDPPRQGQARLHLLTPILLLPLYTPPPPGSGSLSAWINQPTTFSSLLFRNSFLSFQNQLGITYVRLGSCLQNYLSYLSIWEWGNTGLWTWVAQLYQDWEHIFLISILVLSPPHHVSSRRPICIVIIWGTSGQGHTQLSTKAVSSALVSLATMQTFPIIFQISSKCHIL